MRYTPSRTLLASAIASIILAGCGGGSGGSSKNSSSASSSNSSVSTNVAPKFTSGTSVNRDEGTSKATGYVAVATDSDNNPLTYSVSGGADKAQFIIDATSGVLSFITAPDFEQPIDANLDNVYEVEVTVIDGKGGKASQLVQVTIKNSETKLTALSKAGDTALIPGNTVSAQSSCEGCDPSLTKYEWFVEGSDTPVSTANSYKIQAEDRFKKIILKATPYTSSGESGNTESVVMLRNQVKDLLFILGGFVALKTDGSIVADTGDEAIIYTPDSEAAKVKKIYQGGYGFAALTNDDSLIVWRWVWPNNSPQELRRFDIPNVGEVFESEMLSAALTKDGHLYSWGYEIDDIAPPLTDVVDVAIDTSSIAIIKADGSVTYSSKNHGCRTDNTIISSNISKVFITGCAFAGLTKAGKIITWGGPSNDITGLDLTNVIDVDTTREGGAFAATKADKTVVVWGNVNRGGNASGKDLTNVSQVVANYSTFSAIKTDGSVVTWGEYPGDPLGINLSGATKISASGSRFAALTSDGAVITWGSLSASTPSSEPTGVVQLVDTNGRLAALKNDNTVITWGSGWEYSSKADFKDVVKLFGGNWNLAALKNNGEVFSWGNFQYGGNVDDVDLAPFDEIVSSSLELNP